MNNPLAIKVSKVGKSFKLPHEKNTSVKSLVLNPFKKRSYEKQEVLKNIDFEIEEGEFFGIVGRNGSGKSTLLKLLAGIYSPDSGSIEIKGRLTPFIELGVGFNQELTGRENVYLNGALLGFNRKQMNELYDEIVEFAELKRFMDQKLKNYSSGMQVRLAFSIAIQANSDILVLDEVLAVGDYNFQQKCYEYFRKLKKEGKTVILVSHDSSALQMFCTNAILIEKGKIVKRGKTTEVLKAYADQNQSDQENRVEKNINKESIENISEKVVFDNATIFNDEGIKKSAFQPNETLTITYTFSSEIDLKNPVFGLVIQDSEGGQPIFATNTMDKGLVTGTFKKEIVNKVSFVIDNVFNDGRYYISGAIASSDRTKLYVRFLNSTSFKSVGRTNTAKGRVYIEHDFKVKR